MPEPLLQVHEILHTLQGEGAHAGLPCALVRLAGCPLRCSWCDTVHAREGGASIALADLLERIDALGVRRVLVTGGEPLAQQHCLALLEALVEAGYQTLLETSGALDIRPVPAAVHRVVDVKLPSSGEQGRNLASNLTAVGPGDEVKFVVADRLDFDAALDAIARHGLAGRVPLLFSPVHGVLEPRQLARWILRAGVDARLSLQLHKLAFGDEGDAALTAP